MRGICLTRKIGGRKERGEAHFSLRSGEASLSLCCKWAVDVWNEFWGAKKMFVRLLVFYEGCRKGGRKEAKFFIS